MLCCPWRAAKEIDLNVATKERDGYAVTHRGLAGARGDYLAADAAGGLQLTPARGAAQLRLNRAGKQESEKADLQKRKIPKQTEVYVRLQDIRAV